MTGSQMADLIGALAFDLLIIALACFVAAAALQFLIALIFGARS